jgi:hypothetical protein
MSRASTVDFKLNVYNALEHPNFHDARILAVELIDSNALLVNLQEEGGALYRLKLSGLERLRCLDFREGNIILDVSIFRGVPPPVADLRTLLDLRVKESPEYLDTVANRVRAGELSFVHITPSYGCELLALCKNVHIALIQPA